MLRIAGLPVWVAPSDWVAGARAVLGWTDDAVALVATLPERVDRLLDEVEGLLGRVSVIADRADGAIGSIDEVLLGVRAAVSRVETVLVDADAIVRRIDPVITEARAVAEGAAVVVTRAGQVAEGAGEVATAAGTVAAEAHSVAVLAGGATDSARVAVGSADALIGEVRATSAAAAEILALYEPLAVKAAPLAQRFVEDFSQSELDAAIRLIDQLPQLTHHLANDVMPILVTLDRVGPDVHELLDVLKDTRLAIQGVPGFKLFRRRGEREEEEREDAEPDEG